MVLSNAERQALHRQRLKEAAAGTVFVRIFEGPFEDEAIIHDTRMRVVPRVGETIRLRMPSRHESRHLVLAVEHLLDARAEVEVTNDQTGVSVSVRTL